MGRSVAGSVRTVSLYVPLGPGVKLAKPQLRRTCSTSKARQELARTVVVSDGIVIHGHANGMR